MTDQIMPYLFSTTLSYANRSDYNLGHNCNMTMLKVLENIRTKYKEDEWTILVMTDFFKAFDIVDHNLLLHKLRYYFGFSSCAITLFSESVISNSSSESKIVACYVSVHSEAYLVYCLHQ